MLKFKVFPRLIPALCLLAIVVILNGCGGDRSAAERPKVTPVSGTVVYNRQPVEGATVTFHPQGHTHAAVGRTDASGRFRLQTFEPNDGAVAGEYKVTVSKIESSQTASDDPYADDDEPAEHRHLVPERYGLPDSSGFEASVTDGGDNQFNFELTD